MYGTGDRHGDLTAPGVVVEVVVGYLKKNVVLILPVCFLSQILLKALLF